MTVPRPKILSLDDNQLLNSMRQKVLAMAGFDCDVADTAEQAFAMARASRYDALLLDYYLPGTNGIEVAQSMKPLQPKTPIILVTGEELYERSDAVHDYLVKGEGPQALIAKLHSAVSPATVNPKAKHAVAH